jgi:hypothetical protein
VYREGKREVGQHEGELSPLSPQLSPPAVPPAVAVAVGVQRVEDQCEQEEQQQADCARDGSGDGSGVGSGRDSARDGSGDGSGVGSGRDSARDGSGDGSGRDSARDGSGGDRDRERGDRPLAAPILTHTPERRIPSRHTTHTQTTTATPTTTTTSTATVARNTISGGDKRRTARYSRYPLCTSPSRQCSPPVPPAQTCTPRSQSQGGTPSFATPRAPHETASQTTQKSQSQFRQTSPSKAESWNGLFSGRSGSGSGSGNVKKRVGVGVCGAFDTEHSERVYQNALTFSSPNRTRISTPSGTTQIGRGGGEPISPIARRETSHTGSQVKDNQAKTGIGAGEGGSRRKGSGERRLIGEAMTRGSTEEEEEDREKIRTGMATSMPHYNDDNQAASSSPHSASGSEHSQRRPDERLHGILSKGGEEEESQFSFSTAAESLEIF